MSDRILDTIAKALADDEEVAALDHDEARNILATFEAERIAVVELPEREFGGWYVDRDDDDFRVNRVRLLEEKTGKPFTGCNVSWGWMEMNLGPVQARRLAQCLLAALAPSDAEIQE
ncbi:DNA methyltransferase [Mycobacterium phage Omega]|uniref:Uncharacterized protein n=1 Tax=Mycobacterium phage Omega TaxID=2907835 RepID=Q854I1_BPMOM|nr:DNA methyltransferase [Mycobacterium phage Omega]AAN12727.1 hypothetical protein PBI_OMEGA_83 [Mycobacterium phage Omega]